MSLKYLPFASLVDTTFWHVLSKKKLDHLKLNDQPFQGTASFRIDQADGLPPLLSFDYQSFQTVEERGRSDGTNSYIMRGDVIVTNTLEDFKNRDKQLLLDTFALKIWNQIESQDPHDISLNQFLLFTYLDLKKFVFYYWFAFPSFSWPSSVTLKKIYNVQEIFTSDQLKSFQSKYQEAHNSEQFFIISLLKDESIEIHRIQSYSAKVKSDNVKEVFAAFADPSTSHDFPGWPARNLIAYLIKVHHVTDLRLFSYRSRAHDAGQSLIFDLTVDEESRQAPEKVQAVGWEKNQSGKLLPRTVDMSHILDPKKLAQNAVNLNLKLMRWRLVPELDLEKISGTKCLILGAGTLGCNVTRCLLGWGVEHITLVDNSKVSYSNPVRQSLFNFEDCLNGGLSKAEAAAESLKKIYPGVKSRGISMSIPMPGHSVVKEQSSKVSETVEQLESLINDHDVIFLLMDTRESRWLPTLIAQKCHKLVINAALGFDTFLVQRHGIRDHGKIDGEEKELPLKSHRLSGSQLGCYFCNDVVAPGDSTKDRTLDQQCTVTRPGVSMIAAAYAVELLISILQHKDGPNAVAPSILSNGHNDEQNEDEDDESCLGIIPHQIRGFLSRFTEVLPATAAFQNCSACSDVVVKQYQEDGFDFLIKVFNDPFFLEEITGLKKLHEQTNLDDVWALSDNELDSDTASVKSTSVT